MHLKPFRVALVGGILLLAGCADGHAPVNLTNAQSPAAAQSDQHTTAASGFGLGPEDFKTNGGAFGPDQAGP